MPQLIERSLFAALVDIDGTLTELGSVSWLDFTEQMWLMAGRSILEAKEARDLHKAIFDQFRGDIKLLTVRDEKLARIKKLNVDLFEQVWKPSGLELNKRNVEQISRAILSLRLREDGVRFLSFLRILVEQLKVPVFVLTAANSILSDVIASDFKLSGGKASAEMVFDGDSSESLWTHFTLDPDLNRSKVRNADSLKDEGMLPYPSNKIFVVGDGPTEGEMVEYYPNNAILSDTPLKTDRVAVYVKNLDEVMKVMYEQLGSEAEKLILPDEIAGILRRREPV